MGKETITFGNIKCEKHKFHHYKNPIFLKKMMQTLITYLYLKIFLLARKILNTFLVT